MPAKKLDDIALSRDNLYTFDYYIFFFPHSSPFTHSTVVVLLYKAGSFSCLSQDKEDT